MDIKLDYLKGKKIFVFDIETTGLPQVVRFNEYYPYNDNDKYDSSRIVSIAWCLMRNFKNDNEFTIKNHIRTLEGFTIENSFIHKITNEIATSKGKTFYEICNYLAKDLLDADFIIAHNIGFDFNILLNEFQRINRNDLIDKLIDLNMSKAKLCSGELSKDICKLKSFKNSFKMPKLKELYEFTFGHEPEIQHEALNDVQSLIEILINKKIN